MNRRCCYLLALVGAVACAGGCRAGGTQRKTVAAPHSAALADTPGRSDAPADPLHPRVRIETTLGELIVELDAETAPATAMNFVQYVQDGFYDGTIFHRVLKDSMIHGGGYTPKMKEKLRGLRPDIPGAWRSTLPNKRGTIAMLRAAGPAGGRAASTQFYINVVDNPRLDDPKFHGINAVFGRVVEGQDTLERIRNTPVTTHPDYAAGRSAVVPVRTVVIKAIRLIGTFDALEVQAVAAEAEVADEKRVLALIEELERKAGRKAVTTESGLRYVDLVVGGGPPPFITDTVEFNYRGTLLDGTEFESTLETHPAERQVMKLIRGLQQALTTMNEGGRRTVIIPPELAFGERGVPGFVPPDSTLVFEVELLAIQ